MKSIKLLNKLYSYVLSKQTNLYLYTRSTSTLDENLQKELDDSVRLIHDIKNKLHVLYQLHVCKHCNKPPTKMFYFVCPAYDIKFSDYEEANNFCEKFNLLEVQDK